MADLVVPFGRRHTVAEMEGPWGFRASTILCRLVTVSSASTWDPEAGGAQLSSMTKFHRRLCAQQRLPAAGVARLAEVAAPRSRWGDARARLVALADLALAQVKEDGHE